MSDSVPWSKPCSEKGASSWLTSIPLAKYDFSLHEQAFRYALCLIFGWTPTRLPSRVTVRVENQSLLTTPSAAPKEPCHPSARGFGIAARGALSSMLELLTPLPLPTAHLPPAPHSADMKEKKESIPAENPPSRTWNLHPIGPILKRWMGPLRHGCLQLGDWPASLPPSMDNPIAQTSSSSDARLDTHPYN